MQNLQKVSTELKNLFNSSYLTFLRNLLGITYKIKYSYELKACRKIDSDYYLELSSTVRDIFNYSTKNVIEQFIYKCNENSCFKINSTCVEETNTLYYRTF